MTTSAPSPATVDAHGNPMTGDSASIELYDEAIDQLLRYSPGVIDSMTALIEPDSATPMGLAFGAYMHLFSTDRGDLVTARELHTALVRSDGNEREALHERAIGAWIGGEWHAAAALLDDLLLRWPTDLLALALGHQLDFFVGDAQNLRDRPARTLRELGSDDPHAGFVRGMTAFGLEECGHYGQALEAGTAALDENADDVWAVHAVTHTYEMQGRVAEGIQFMADGMPHWGSGNLFTVHNWWHLALFLLEAGRTEEALAIYDTEIHHEGSAGVPIEMLDASALLWRLHLDGNEVGNRFERLADAWMASADTASDASSRYLFNDLHAVVALTGAGRLIEARSLVAAIEDQVSEGSGSNAEVFSTIGLPACRAIVAYGDGRDFDVIAELQPIRHRLNRFGGSHAQRDLLHRTLLDSLIRAGRYDEARALASERLGVRESSVYSWIQRARALRGLGDDTGAAVADAAAAEHRAAFASVGVRR